MFVARNRLFTWCLILNLMFHSSKLVLVSIKHGECMVLLLSWVDMFLITMWIFFVLNTWVVVRGH